MTANNGCHFLNRLAQSLYRLFSNLYPHLPQQYTFFFIQRLLKKTLLMIVCPMLDLFPCLSTSIQPFRSPHDGHFTGAFFMISLYSSLYFICSRLDETCGNLYHTVLYKVYIKNDSLEMAYLRPFQTVRLSSLISILINFIF